MSKVYGLVERNKKEDLYIVEHEDGRVVYIPKGWCDEFDDKDHGGPSYLDPDTGEPCPELYGYGFVGAGFTESGFDTIYWRVSDLEQGRIVTETEARTIDPALFEHLARINRGDWS